jgi:hypothetical protein
MPQVRNDYNTTHCTNPFSLTFLYFHNGADEDNTEQSVDSLPVRASKRTKTDEDLEQALPAPQEAYDFKINPVGARC